MRPLYKSTALMIGVLLIQLLLLSLTIPLTGLLEPSLSFFAIDHPYHVYQVDLGRSLLGQGLLVGYDPYFGAGHVGGVTFNASAKLPLLLSLVLPATVPTAELYALYVFACALIAPVAVVAAATILRWPGVHTIIAATIGILFWWLSAFHWYHTAGMVSFVLASYLAIPYAAWLVSICIHSNRTLTLGSVVAGLAGGVGLWLHPLFGLLAGALTLTLLGSAWPGLVWRHALVRLGLVAAIALALNLPWIVAMAGTGGLLAYEVPHQRNAGIEMFYRPLLGIWSGTSMGSLLNPFCTAVACIGYIRLRGQLRQQIGAFLFAGLILVLFSAFAGASAKLATVQPNRFMAPGFLLIGLAASAVLGEWYRWTKSAALPAKSLAAVAVIAFLAWSLRELVREVTVGDHGHYGRQPPEMTDLPPAVAWLETWINANTQPNGRILFENSNGRIHGGGHVAGYLARKTGREFIGGPYPFVLHASAWDGVAFGRWVSQMSPKEFARELDLHNVGWIVAHSDDLIRLLGQTPNVRPRGEFERIRVFEVERPLSYFEVGSGRVVDRDFNRIEFADVEGPTAVIRYHWVPGLATTPATHIEAVRIDPEIEPFIRIDNPPREFILTRPRGSSWPRGAPP